MMDNYFNEFLGDGISTKEENLPSWVSESNSSKEVYDQINKLKKTKQRYIQGHSLKSHFKKKSLFLISKEEAVKGVGTAPSIFRCTTYSKDLRTYLGEINDELINDVNIKISKKSKGLQNKSKAELKKTTQDCSKELTELKKKNCEEMYTILLSNMPLDIRQKLGLKNHS
jgi:hypothetical protein